MVFQLGQDDEAAKVVSLLVAFVAIVFANALVELGALARPTRVAELVESKWGLEKLDYH